MTDYSIPSFTVTTSTPIVTAGDNSVKNPCTSSKQTYTSTYNNIAATKNDLHFYIVSDNDNSDVYTDYYIEANGKTYHSDSTGKTERLDDSQVAKFKNLIKRDDYHGNKYIEVPASKCRGSEYFYTIFKKPEVHFYIRLANEIVHQKELYCDYVVWRNKELIHRFVDKTTRVLDYEKASEFKEAFASGAEFEGYKWVEIDPEYCNGYEVFTSESYPYRYYKDLHDKEIIYILDVRTDKVYWFRNLAEGTTGVIVTDHFGDSWFKAENLKNEFYYKEINPYDIHNYYKLKFDLDKKNKEMRNLTKKEQEKYTENITKVYEPTGYTLDEVAKKSEEMKDGSFDNLLKVISGLKDYIDDKDKLSKAQTDILLAAQAYKATKTKDKFCRSYSLTNEEVDRMNKWIAKHNKKLHPKGLGYQGAIGVSHDEVRMTSTSIGVGIDCVCIDCLKLYEEKKAEVAKLRRACKDDVPTRMRKKDLKKSLKKEEKKLDKLYKQAVFEIRGIDD